MPVVMSPKQKQYFEKIQKDVEEIYNLANKARAEAKVDPSMEVESPPAMDMAGRVESLVGPKGIGDFIRKWKEEGIDQDQICFRAMDGILEGSIGSFDKKKAVDRAIRTALAIKTDGVVSAPLEGIGNIEIRENKLGGDPYLSLYFAGPIRAAGGTVQAFAILCGDYVREKMHIAPWKATEEEVARIVEEVKLYDRIMNLQYPSSTEEIAYAVRHLTVELNGDPTEDQEVSAHRDLPRMETNFVRGGLCLVLNDGLLSKAKKISKIIESRKIQGWDWLKDLKKFQVADQVKSDTKPQEKDAALDYGGDTYKGQKMHEESQEKTKTINYNPVLIRRKTLDAKNPPIDKFVTDIIGGRPVFGYPSRIGSHRLRYGRSRNTGLAGCGMHPSTMIILEKFCAIGTQIRIERPGKSGVTMPVTSIEPPIVLLTNGDVKQLWDIQEAKEISDGRKAKKILFLGDILFGFGEFAENNHTIIPSGYVEEWWAIELESKLRMLKENGQNPFDHLPEVLSESILDGFIRWPFDQIPTGRQSLEISKRFEVGLHPRYLEHWGNLNGWELIELRNSIELGLQQKLGGDLTTKIDLSSKSWIDLENSLKDGLIIQNSPTIKTALENIYCPHTVEGDSIRLDSHRSLIFLEILGFGNMRALDLNIEKIHTKAQTITALELFPYLTKIKIFDKAPYYLGSRMGRPEKARERKMKPPVHMLFPVGHASELQRTIQTAAAQPFIEVDICQKKCPACSTLTFLNKCPKCGEHTDFLKICHQCNNYYSYATEKCSKCQTPLSYFSPKKFNLKKYFDEASSHIPKKVPSIKGVKGMSSEFKCPEPLEKGILRAINEVWVYKDGTARVDQIDVPLTHFTCREIGVTVDKIKSLGYEKDIDGHPITDETQVIELKIQDILLNHHLGEYFIRVANFVDDELEYIYQKPRFYNVKTSMDLIGHYFLGLAPHTSAGIIGRLIGFTHAEAGYAHPFWHAAKRRNCDGDEDGLMFLLDCLLNFSRAYLPAKLGGKMDAPLVISIRLDPQEVDAESHNVDYMSRYPLQFYLDSQNYAKPGEVEKYMVTFRKKLGTEAQFEGSMFTHPTLSINLGPHKSAYTLFETMEEKIESQLWLARAISAVDAQDVARKVIASHFAPDILGNIRSYTTQSFRCPKCGKKYRRMPLVGKCLGCGGKLLLTVNPGGITKYLGKAMKMIEDFQLSAYTAQRWQLIETYVNSLTNNPRIKQRTMNSFFR